jgi:hypothetical protein
MQQRDEKLAVAVVLSPDELAVAAALQELIDPKGARAIDGDVLLRYAKRTFGAGGDLVVALRTLEERGLVKFVTENGKALVAPRARTKLVGATLAGRAATELGRMPIPRAASAVFARMVARARPFTNASYGFGSASAGDLSGMAMRLRQMESPGTLLSRTPPGSNLLMRADFAGRAFYAAITFPDGAARDNAQSQLEDLVGHVLDEQFSVTDALAHPFDVVPSRRFLNAAERLAGPLTQWPLNRPVVLRRAEAVGVEDALRLKAQTLAAVRARMTPAERNACALERPIGYAVFVEGDHSIEVQIIGGAGLQVLKTPPDISWNDPFEWFRLGQALTLGPDEHLGRQRSRLGPPSTDDPAVSVLAELQQRAAYFNKHQRKKHVLLDAQTLEAELIAVACRQLDDAMALAGAVSIGGKPRVVQAWTTHLVIFLDPPDPNLVPGGYSGATVTHALSASGQEEVHVDIVHRLQREPAHKSVDLPEGVLYRTSGDMHSIVAGLLGHTEDEVSFSYPNGRS